MATIVNRRRGTTAQHAVFTGALGEITIDTDKDVAVVHDGVTPGGFPLAGTLFANIFSEPQRITTTADAPQLIITTAAGQTTQAFQIFQPDGTTQVFGVNFSGTTQIIRQSADTAGARLDFQKRGTTGSATAAVASGDQISMTNFFGWEGSAFGISAQMLVHAREAFTPTARGSEFRFNTAAIGSFAQTLVATLNTSALTLAVPLDMGTHLINNVVNPVAAQDAATKAYVDASATAGAPPFTDTTALVKGSGDPTKLMRFEVDGFTAATTRVLTPPNADITLAGINISQTFTPLQLFTDGIRVGIESSLDDTDGLLIGIDMLGLPTQLTPAGSARFASGTFTISAAGVTVIGTIDSVPLTLTQSVSGSGNNEAFFVVPTWDTSGSPIAIRLNVLDIASGAASLLMDLQVGSVSKFSVSKTGATTITAALDMSSNLINNVTNPVSAQDAATKSYVDGLIAAGAPPFIDSTALVKGSADATKLMRFEVDGFTTATTRVLTPPNADITLAGINIANAWADGVTQTFNPNGTSSGINVGAHTADPSALVNGDIWYQSTANELRARINGVNVALGVSSMTQPYRAISGTDTFSATDYTINATSGTFTLNLPTAVGITGRIYVAKNSGAGIVTLDADGGELIDGLTTQTINPGASLTVQSTGAGWIII